MATNGIYLVLLVSSHLNNWLSKGRMNITPSFRIYHSHFLPLFLFFICVCSSHTAWAETDSTVVPELSIDNPDVNTGNTPVWDNYNPQPSTANTSNTIKEGYAKPIATIVPSAKSVVQGEVIYFRLEHENAGASFYWIMGDQRGADRLLKVDTSDLKPGKHRVRVSVTNKARQQANNQLIFEVLAKPESASPDKVTVNSPAVADEPVNETTENKPETPIDPVETSEASPVDSPSITESDSNEKMRVMRVKKTMPIMTIMKVKRIIMRMLLLLLPLLSNLRC